MNENFLIFDCKALTAIVYSIREIQIQQQILWGTRYQSQINYSPDADNEYNKIKKFESSTAFINFYIKNYNIIKYSILVGTKAETTSLYKSIIKEIGKTAIIFCFVPSSHQKQDTENNFLEIKPQAADIDLRQLVKDLSVAFSNSQSTYFKAIEKSINDLRNTIGSLQQSKTVPVAASRSNCNTIELKEEIGKMAETLRQTHYFANEIYNNIPTSTNVSGSEARIEELQNELGKYKNDFYLKASLPYVNAAIEMLCIMYEDLYNLKKTEDIESPMVERMRRVISASEVYVKRLNVQIRTSHSGDAWDPHSMRAYDDRIATKQEELRGHVACSISPAFFWTLPRVNAPGADYLLLKEETVALFE